MPKKKCKLKSGSKNKKTDIKTYTCAKCGLKAEVKDELCKPVKKT
jgi:hypothetical protein